MLSEEFLCSESTCKIREILCCWAMRMEGFCQNCGCPNHIVSSFPHEVLPFHHRLLIAYVQDTFLRVFNNYTMRHSLSVFCLLLIFPATLQGQVLQEVTNESTGLPDPDQYPLETFFKVGPPIATFSGTTGYQNMRQYLEDRGLEYTRFREMITLEGGIRFKRFYAEIGTAIEFTPFISDPVSNGFVSIHSVSSVAWLGTGYSVWQDRNSALLFHVGLGHKENSIHFRQVQNLTPVDFDNLFVPGAGNPSILLNHQNTFWDIGVEWWQGRAKNRVSAGEAFRIGYRRGINETAWETPNTTSLNAPLDRMGEIYLNACFHLGRAYPSKG